MALEQHIAKYDSTTAPNIATVRELQDELRAMALGRWSPTMLSMQQLITEARNTKNASVLEHSHDPKYRFKQIARQLEQLPIQTEGLVQFGWAFFVLPDAACWWPAHVGVIKNMPWGRTLNVSIHHTDGSVDTLVSLPGRWAQCTQDNHPHMQYEDIEKRS